MLLMALYKVRSERPFHVEEPAKEQAVIELLADLSNYFCRSRACAGGCGPLQPRGVHRCGPRSHLRRARDGARIHVIRRAPESHDAHVTAQVHEVDERLLYRCATELVWPHPERALRSVHASLVVARVVRPKFVLRERVVRRRGQEPERRREEVSSSWIACTRHARLWQRHLRSTSLNCAAVVLLRTEAPNFRLIALNVLSTSNRGFGYRRRRNERSNRYRADPREDGAQVPSHPMRDVGQRRQGASLRAEHRHERCRGKARDPTSRLPRGAPREGDGRRRARRAFSGARHVSPLRTQERVVRADVLATSYLLAASLGLMPAAANDNGHAVASPKKAHAILPVRRRTGGDPLQCDSATEVIS